MRVNYKKENEQKQMTEKIINLQDRIVVNCENKEILILRWHFVELFIVIR